MSVPPQPSGMVPQLSPVGHLVIGVQPQTLAVPPPPQVAGDEHEPHVTRPPHPLETVPQLSPGGQVNLGVQPQMFPPQGLPTGQVPQDTVPPHPSGTVPQLSPEGHDVIGVQEVTLPGVQFPAAIDEAVHQPSCATQSTVTFAQSLVLLNPEASALPPPRGLPLMARLRIG